MACSANEGAEKCIKQFSRKPRTNKIAIKENNIKMRLNCDGGDVIRLADTKALSSIHCCRGKAMSITYSECVCSLRCSARNALAP